MVCVLRTGKQQLEDLVYVDRRDLVYVGDRKGCAGKDVVWKAERR